MTAHLWSSFRKIAELRLRINRRYLYSLYDVLQGRAEARHRTLAKSAVVT